MPDEELYAGRTQTLIKHIILEKYLQRFAFIVGRSWPSITYVDGFSGPWNSQSERFEDTSFGIAIRILRSVRDDLAQKGENLQIRCFFLEKDPDAFLKLKEFCDDIDDVEIRPKRGELENSVNDIVSFVNESRGTFPFIFLDPKGWSALALDTITPLLRLEPGEVLINFMTSHIRRFILASDDALHESMVSLFGTDRFFSELQKVHNADDKMDVMVDLYAEQIKLAGKFDFVSKSIVLDPIKESAHYHLIYGTRHPKGIDVLKDVEKSAMKTMENQRYAIPEGIPEQLDLPEVESGPQNYYEQLRVRYSQKAQQALLALIRANRTVTYNDALNFVLQYPLTWKSDLDGWLKIWKDKEVGFDLPSNKTVAQRSYDVVIHHLGS